MRGRARTHERPSAHEDFDPKADTHFKLVSPEALKNRKTLQDAMTRHGFQIYDSEMVALRRARVGEVSAGGFEVVGGGVNQATTRA